MAGDVTRWATAVCAVLHCLGTDEAEPKRRQDGRCLSCWLSGWRTCSALAEFLQSILEALLWVLAWPMRFAPAAPTLTNQLQISILIKDSASRFSPSRGCKNKSINQNQIFVLHNKLNVHYRMPRSLWDFQEMTRRSRASGGCVHKRCEGENGLGLLKRRREKSCI